MVLKTITTTNGSMPRSRLRQKTISFNGILQFCNGIVACLIFSGFFTEALSGHPYMDWLTLFLGLAMCLQTHFVLMIERYRPDPFVLIMSYLLIFFYETRIFTLLLYPVQGAFERFIYGPSDSNYALLYILVANTFIYAGLYKIKIRDSAVIKIGNYRPLRPRLGIVLFIISILFGQFIRDKLPGTVEPFINLIYDNFFTPNVILMVLAAYIIVFRNSLPPVYVKILLIGAVLILILQTMAFSRSALLTFANNFLIVVLALLPTLRISRKYVLIGFTFMPVLLVTAFTFYAISTTSRMNKGDKGSTFTEKVELFQASLEVLDNNPQIDFFLGRAFSRAGFFDFSAEIIANSDHYSGVFTAGNYFKSIVDNLLSPGFDVFDQPKLSNSLKYAYSNVLGNPAKSKEIGGVYHTDFFGIYGEMYGLFHYASLPVVYIIAYMLKSAFRCKGKVNPRLIALKRILILWIFFQLMNSYGFDWLLIDAVIIGLSYYGISKLFLLRIKLNHKFVDLV